MAQLHQQGKSKRLGLFEFEEDAAHADDAAAKKAFGRGATLNFPD